MLDIVTLIETLFHTQTWSNNGGPSYREGILTCSHGKEEKDAAEMPWHGMVDEEEAVAIPVKAKSSPFWTSEMGSHGRRRWDGNDQRLAWGTEEGHQALSLPGPHQKSK